MRLCAWPTPTSKKRCASELRAYYAKLLDPETQAALDDDRQGPVMRWVVKQMAADGWLGIGWPKEYGGQGKTRRSNSSSSSTSRCAPVPRSRC